MEQTLIQRPFFLSEGLTSLSVPLISHPMQAGFPSPAADYTEDALDFNAFIVRNKPSTFVFEVAGLSMIGVNIDDRDMVVVDRSIEPQHKYIVVAVVDGEFTIKQLILQDGLVELHPANPDFKPIQFKDGSELEIWGVVTFVIRRLLPKK